MDVDADVTRNMNNFARIPAWNCIFTKRQVEEIVDRAGDFIMCNGRIRDFVFRKITDDRFHVSTKERIYA